mgnify:CR=1 FL=1
MIANILFTLGVIVISLFWAILAIILDKITGKIPFCLVAQMLGALGSIVIWSILLVQFIK